MAQLYIVGWRGLDWRGKLMGRHVAVTHVTLRLVISKRLSVSLHTDTNKCDWRSTKALEKSYQGHFKMVTSRCLGFTDTETLWQGGSAHSELQTAAWWYGGRYLCPSWRPNGCVKNVREAAQFYGFELSDTAFTDKLFYERITACK